MNNKKDNLLIIGAGFMGSSLAGGILSANLPFSVTVSDIDEKKLDTLKESVIHLSSGESKPDFTVSKNSIKEAAKADVIILAVKPNVINTVLKEISPLCKEKLIISIAAGVKINTIEAIIPDSYIVRAMPNLCVQIKEGVLAYCTGTKAIPDEFLCLTEKILGAVGSCFKVSEKQMDAVTGLSGSAPAFVFMMIEALSDGGVLAGLPRDISTKLSAQTVLGSAKMVLETNTHPDQLKDRVTSPAGTTIEGVAVLEEAGIRSAFMKAVKAASDKSKALGDN